MTESQLSEAVGLVTRFHYLRKQAVSQAALFEIQRRLLILGVQLDNPVESPDPTAPPGGSSVKVAA